MSAVGRARSWLYVPGHRADLVGKALDGAADAIVVDLEDAVPPAFKEQARETAVATCASRPNRIWVRINAAGSDWAEDDAAALAGRAAAGLRVPKAEDPAVVAALAERTGLPLHLLIESARGLRQVFELAECHPLVAGVSPGETDLAADLRIREHRELGFARARIVTANRAAGLPSPIASVWTDLADTAGLTEDSTALRDAGFFGRSVIHPGQIEPVHRAFTPGRDEVRRARSLLDSLDVTGDSAAWVDDSGRFVDPAVVAGARWVSELADSLDDLPHDHDEPARTRGREGERVTAPSTAGSGLLDAVRAGTRTIELGHPLYTGMAGSPNHPGFRMTLERRHGDAVRPDGGSASNEVIVTGGHTGTHVDALAHVSHDGKLHGGIDAAEAQCGGKHTAHGAETIPPMVTRGVFLDVAAVHGVDVLEPGYGVTADDLARAAERAGAEPGPGDVVVVRTGWGRLFSDPQAYVGKETGVPGMTVPAARWLAEREIVATGTDTTAYEQIPAGAGHRVLPVHRELLVEHGIHIVEHMACEDAAEAGLGEFLAVFAPLRIVGGTGAPVRPLAVVPA